MPKRQVPLVFVGHGSPMIALEDNEITDNFARLGQWIREEYQPKGILSISAHWFRTKTRVQSASKPKQIYDFAGFPDELSQLIYQPPGSSQLTQGVLDLLGDGVIIDDEWGIDHGSWTVLCHMFPEADMPVVQLSIDMLADYETIFEIGEKLSPLRDDYLILGTGNIVHNLWKVNWLSSKGSQETMSFDSYVQDIIMAGDHRAILEVEDHPDYKYAVPRQDHFAPLVYVLGAAGKAKAQVFNQIYQLDTIAMTSYIFQ